MSRVPYQIQDLAATDQLLTPYVILPYRTATTTVGAPATGVFHSTIIGRGKMVDLSNDLSVRMGIERIQVQSIMRVDGEVGPAGEVVWKPVNDKYDQIRFVGSWTSPNNTAGAYCNSSTATTDFCEITFYGTALNILATDLDNTRDARATVDGGTEGANFIAASLSAVINLRNYAQNVIVPVISGLSLGLHTVKIRNVNWLRLSGFEILNTASTLQIAAGTALISGTAASLSAATTSAYNSGFESGTLGTRGGRVLVYMKNDGTIGKAVTPTDASSLTLTSTNHANEEVIRSYFWREFGAGRTDDFSTLTTSNRSSVFTLDDGTTTLVASSVKQYVETAGLREGITVSSVGEFITFTFVGTGVDVTQERQNTATTTYNVIVDGVTIASAVSGVTLFGTTPRVNKIVSGLPYGTHTLKIQVAAGGTDCTFGSFIVYGPKKPTIPAGAIELADYNVMADYVPVSAGDIQGSVAQGVLRKHGIREAVYSGTWATTGLDATYEGGIYIAATANASYVEYTFWGTGFDLRCGSASNGDPASQLTLDGSTNFSAYTTSFYGTGINFTAATGVLDQLGSDTSGCGVSVRGLTLGKHVIRTTKTSGTFIYAFAIDVITPIHVHKNNGPFVLQNTLSVGSQGINDGRKVGSQLIAPRNASQAFGVTNGPTTTATTLAPMPDMSIAIKTTGNPIRISYSHYVQSNNAAAYTYSQLMVDGVIVGSIKAAVVPNAQYPLTISDSLVVPVAAGNHTVVLGWYTTAGTMVGINNSRNLTVEEIANS